MLLNGSGEVCIGKKRCVQCSVGSLEVIIGSTSWPYFGVKLSCVCLKQPNPKVTYIVALLQHNSHPKVTYTYPKVTYSGPKIT